MDRIKKATITKIKNKIVKGINPSMIFLFGSYATGKEDKNSDIDIMCVEDKPFGLNRSRRKEIAKIYRLLSEFEIPMDILLYSKDEIAKWKTSKNHIIPEIIREGKIIHERF
ncbi:nucleotidyltransferase domain-containing protein [bacterium]|nr:nucleotidyltransferase domain-containing protein [bacterium]